MKPLPEPHDQAVEVIQEVLDRIREVTRALDSREILQLLTGFQGQLANEIDVVDHFADRRTGLLAEIPGSSDFSYLGELHQALNTLEMEQFLKVTSVTALHNHCTEYRDLLILRALTLVEEEMVAAGRGAPPTTYALISTGSDGREEQTLITDQDHLIVYGDDGGEMADDWFARFSHILVDRLEEMGFKKCTGDMMPSNPTWRGSFQQWRKRLISTVRYECDPEDYGKNMMELIVLSDARYVAGNRELAEQLVEMIRTMERDYFQVLWGMAKAATEMKLAIGFMKRLWTEGSGEHKGEFNLKLLAWAPLVMNVRILAINQGIPATNTLRRIDLLREEKSFSVITADELKEAYEVLTRHRILLQIKVIKGIQKDSYHLNPYSLPAEERDRIRHALLRIEELQKTIHTNFSIV